MGDDGQISDVIFAVRIVKNGIFRSTARVEASFPLFAVRIFWLRFRRTVQGCRKRRFLRPCMRKATVSLISARRASPRPSDRGDFPARRDPDGMGQPFAFMGGRDGRRLALQGGRGGPPYGRFEQSPSRSRCEHIPRPKQAARKVTRRPSVLAGPT